MKSAARGVVSYVTDVGFGVVSVSAFAVLFVGNVCGPALIRAEERALKGIALRPPVTGWLLPNTELGGICTWPRILALSCAESGVQDTRTARMEKKIACLI